jgi:hypothetical protein
MSAGEGPFVSDRICQKIICLEKYVSGFIEVLGRANFTFAVRSCVQHSQLPMPAARGARAGKGHAVPQA